MQKLFVALAILFVLTGCVRKMTVEQGNIMTPEMTSQIHKGMTQAEVRNIMGTPLVLNTFRDNRVDYVYTIKPGGAATSEKRLTLIFQNDHLSEMIENTYTEKKK